MKQVYMNAMLIAQIKFKFATKMMWDNLNNPMWFTYYQEQATKYGLVKLTIERRLKDNRIEFKNVA